MPPWSDFHAKLHRLLRQRGLLPFGQRVLVAVSGGQDSICLLHLLADLQPKWGWGLDVVHCDHRWRPDSAENAAFVQQVCDRIALPCHLRTAAVPPTTEAEARTWRYQVLETVALAQGCTHVVTGHTATDRAETLLYNLIRGSGADGLQAMTWQRPLRTEPPALRLVRPLLAMTRAETGAFCDRNQLPIWVDRTNHDRTYARNRLRLEVMPLLRQQFNPAVEKALSQTAEVLTAEVAFLEQGAADLYGQVVRTSTAGWQLQRRQLQSAHLALQRRVCRRVLQELTTAQVTFEQVEKLVTLIEAPNRSQSDPFPGGMVARVEGDWIVLQCDPSRQPPPTRDDDRG